MRLKILTCTFAMLVLAESGYILLVRHRPINRFKPVDEDGYLAFDSATGQLCRTARPRPVPKGIRSSASPSSLHSGESRRGDPILEAIDKSAPDLQAEEDARVEFIRDLPACADIH
jgi:hypothetical protein